MTPETELYGCTYDGMGLGKCGTTVRMDNCQINLPDPMLHCAHPGSVIARASSAAQQFANYEKTFMERGFSFGRGALCVRSTLWKREMDDGERKGTLTWSPMGASCQRFRCDPGAYGAEKLSVYVSPSPNGGSPGGWAACPPGGHADLAAYGFLGGQLGPCPDPQAVCPDVKCLEVCQQGICQDGRCHCHPGYAGYDCGTQECARDSDLL